MPDPTAAPTPIAQELAATLARMRAARRDQPPLSLAQRRADLQRLRRAIVQGMDGMIAALNADFGTRSRHESLISDGWTVIKTIDQLLANLRTWSRPEPRSPGWLMWPARGELRPMPLGVVGVMSPWNYPVNLALVPLATAIAAGNSVFLKPSEFTPRTSDWLAELLASVFPIEQVSVVRGGAEVAAPFAALPFDHLLFTGSTAVGRKIMAAAAANLTPVTLELGGKSPLIVADDFELSRAAARIATGKLFNGGQTCIAPDYVLISESRRDALVEALRRDVAARFPDRESLRHYTRVVNEGQYRRLRASLDDAAARGATLVPLFDVDPAWAESERLLPLTVVIDPPDDCRVMQEELFGPILPICGFQYMDEAVHRINGRERPLSLYLFSHDRRVIRHVLDRCIAGGVTINDALLQFAAADLPFGGIGASGMGQYHAREGFDTFSKRVPVVYQSRFTGFDYLLRQPYQKIADWLVRFLTR